MSERDHDNVAGLDDAAPPVGTGEKVAFSDAVAAPLGEDAGKRKPVRSLMRKWRAIMLLAIGALVLSIALSMMHG